MIGMGDVREVNQETETTDPKIDHTAIGQVHRIVEERN